MDKKKRVFTVLAIDGGGVRGLTSARILQEIEERTGKPISELFDLIGANSTGAILGAGLVIPDPDEPEKPKYSAQEIKNYYHRDAPRIFPEMRFKSIRKLSSGALYDPKPLEEALERKLGETRLHDSLTSLMIPATDIKNFRPVWIKHIKGQKDSSPEGWSSMYLKDAVRATTTAPTFFPAKYYETTPNEDMPDVTHRHALIDGGFFSGNLMRRLLTQAKKLAPEGAEIVVVHIGTGNVENALSPEEFNKLGPLGLVSKANGSLILSLVLNMGAMDIATDLKEEIGDNFFSFDGCIAPEDDADSPSNSMDDASEHNLQLLEKFGEKIIADNETEMDRMCDILKHRLFAKERHLDSKEALVKLTEKLESAKTVKSLTRTYRKILRYSSGMADEKPEYRDPELQALALRLEDNHKNDLDRIYNVLQDKLENQSQILNSIRQAGDDLTQITRKIFVDPFKPDQPPPNTPDAPPPGSNDNPKPPAAQHTPLNRKFGR